MNYVHVNIKTANGSNAYGIFPTGDGSRNEEYYRIALRSISDGILSLPLKETLKALNWTGRPETPEMTLIIDGITFKTRNSITLLEARINSAKAQVQTKSEYSAKIAFEARKKAWMEEEPDFIVLKLIPVNDTF